MPHTTLKQKALEYLRRNPKRKFTARQIAIHLINKYREEFDKKQRKSDRISTEEQLIQAVSGEINTALKSMLKSRQLKTFSVPSPKKFCWIKKD